MMRLAEDYRHQFTALYGPEHHPLPVEIVAELVVVLFQDLDEEGGSR